MMYDKQILLSGVLALLGALILTYSSYSRKRIRIFVKILCGYPRPNRPGVLNNKSITTLDVKRSDTIESVKIKIQESEGIPTCHQMKIIFARHQLKDTRTLAYYGVQNNSTLYMEFHLKIFVEVKGRQRTIKKAFVVEAKSSDAIEVLKKKICETQNIPYEEQVLLFGP